MNVINRRNGYSTYEDELSKISVISARDLIIQNRIMIEFICAKDIFRSCFLLISKRSNESYELYFWIFVH